MFIPIIAPFYYVALALFVRIKLIERLSPFSSDRKSLCIRYLIVAAVAYTAATVTLFLRLDLNILSYSVAFIPLYLFFISLFPFVHTYTKLQSFDIRYTIPLYSAYATFLILCTAQLIILGVRLDNTSGAAAAAPLNTVNFVPAFIAVALLFLFHIVCCIRK